MSTQDILKDLLLSECPREVTREVDGTIIIDATKRLYGANNDA